MRSDFFRFIWYPCVTKINKSTLIDRDNIEKKEIPLGLYGILL